MLNSPIHSIFITCLLCIWLNECAYLVLGPLEVSQDERKDAREDGPDAIKIVPKREPRDNKLSATTASNIDDDAEIVDQIPYCTNLFRSPAGTREMKNSQVSSQCDPSVHNVRTHLKLDESCAKYRQPSEHSGQTGDINAQHLSTIKYLKEELSKERELVKNLTAELNLIRKLCEECPSNYVDYEYNTNNSNDKIQSIQSSIDLYDLFNSKELNGNKHSSINLTDDDPDITQNEDCYNGVIKNNLLDTSIKNRTNNIQQINKNLFNDNVYQIPNFSVNDHKSYSNPNIFNDLPVVNPNMNDYRAIHMHNPNIVLPFKEPNKQNDILRTLYPQFFLDEPNESLVLSDSKRSNGRTALEPSQIYINNMKQLTAPYRIFPNRFNPDLRYIIRDRRDNLEKLRRNKRPRPNINKKNLIRRKYKRNRGGIKGSRPRKLGNALSANSDEPLRAGNSTMFNNQESSKYTNGSDSSKGANDMVLKYEDSPFNHQHSLKGEKCTAFNNRNSSKQGNDSLKGEKNLEDPTKGDDAFNDVPINRMNMSAFKTKDLTLSVHDPVEEFDSTKENFYISSKEFETMKDTENDKPVADKDSKKENIGTNNSAKPQKSDDDSSNDDMVKETEESEEDEIPPEIGSKKLQSSRNGVTREGRDESLDENENDDGPDATNENARLKETCAEDQSELEVKEEKEIPYDDSPKESDKGKDSTNEARENKLVKEEPDDDEELPKETEGQDLAKDDASNEPSDESADEDILNEAVEESDEDKSPDVDGSALEEDSTDEDVDSCEKTCVDKYKPAQSDNRRKRTGLRKRLRHAKKRPCKVLQ